MSKVIEASQKWVESMVVGLNLCPFAKREVVKNRVRYVDATVTDLESLLALIESELTFLREHDDVETTMLMTPSMLADFDEYLDALVLSEQLVNMMGMQGEFQIASFHPDYCFEGVEHDAVENYTNRAPYPTFHLLREASLEGAIERYPDTEQIPETNIALMQSMGIDRIRAMLNQCS